MRLGCDGDGLDGAFVRTAVVIQLDRILDANDARCIMIFILVVILTLAAALTPCTDVLCLALVLKVSFGHILKHF